MSDMLNRYLCASDSYSDFLAHHGILGQKWGIRRYQNPDGTLTEEGKKRYGKSIYNNTKFNNLNTWGKSKDTNVLYVTGQSGGGKSTLAEYMSDRSTSAIHLDAYFDSPYGDVKGNPASNKRFNDYLDKNFPDYVKLSLPKDKISLTDWGKVCEGFEEHVEKFGASEYVSGRKVICEGVELLDDTMRPDKSFFKSKPTAIVNTSAITSSIRSRERDGVKLRSLDDIMREFKWYSQSRKDLNNFRKQAMTR